MRLSLGIIWALKNPSQGILGGVVLRTFGFAVRSELQEQVTGGIRRTRCEVGVTLCHGHGTVPEQLLQDTHRQALHRKVRGVSMSQNVPPGFV